MSEDLCLSWSTWFTKVEMCYIKGSVIVLFPISLPFDHYFFYWCAVCIIVCYCLLIHVHNPESEYSTPQLLTSDSSCLISCYSCTQPCSSVLQRYINVPHNILKWLLNFYSGRLMRLLAPHPMCLCQPISQKWFWQVNHLHLQSLTFWNYLLALLFYLTLSFVTIHLSRVLLCLVCAYLKAKKCSETLSLVDTIEWAAGPSLFSEAAKACSEHICWMTKCEVIIHRFDDVQKKGRKAIAAPK